MLNIDNGLLLNFVTGLLVVIVGWIVNRLVGSMDRLAVKIDRMDEHLNQKVSYRRAEEIAEDKSRMAVMDHQSKHH